jgi:DNA-binding Lrp family transcriptional regulator
MFNQRDLQIIYELRKNSRETLTEMSKKTSIPVSTIYTRILSFNGRVIRKHTSLLDFGALGFHTVALVFVSCEPSHREALTLALVKAEQVNSVFKLDDEYYIMFEGVFRFVNEVYEFLEGLESRYAITKRKVFYIAKEMRREGFFAHNAEQGAGS